MNPQRSRAALALLVIVSTAVSVLLVEATCQVYMRVFLADRPLGRGEFRATRPLAFTRADSHSVNVENGLRRTTNQPPHAERRLLVFGGSTAEEEYRHALVAAHQLVVAGQGEFIHFLQPHLFATPPSTAYRRELSSNYRETPPGLDTAFRLGYPRLREALANARQDGVVSFDLSDLLAAERLPDDVFLDFAHVNDIGNEIIARAMFARIADRIGDCEPSRYQPPVLLEKR